uniref:Uncharacterized protein n=1 Tax=Desertifilum tharense IPPAS B-1220 TaxID=1781255 RepID=A0A1E5QCH1_9CYAN|nr:hypothetical protein BH720_25075 [Desertifilum tharense IPPAS B-1220]
MLHNPFQSGFKRLPVKDFFKLKEFWVKGSLKSIDLPRVSDFKGLRQCGSGLSGIRINPYICVKPLTENFIKVG